MPVIHVILVVVIDVGMHMTPSTLITVKAVSKLVPVMIIVVPPFDGPYLGKTADTVGVFACE